MNHKIINVSLFIETRTITAKNLIRKICMNGTKKGENDSRLKVIKYCQSS